MPEKCTDIKKSKLSITKKKAIHSTADHVKIITLFKLHTLCKAAWYLSGRDATDDQISQFPTPLECNIRPHFM